MTYITLDEEKVQKVIEGWRDTGVSLSELLEAMEPVEEETHDDCDREYCEFCRREARKQEAERYAQAQVDYYKPGGFFDTIFDGAFDEKSTAGN